jgi:hypothetical protein
VERLVFRETDSESKEIAIISGILETNYP